ncbi:MAG: hypothetical protein AB1488_04925 [Nitrospirota bacterium]
MSNEKNEGNKGLMILYAVQSSRLNEVIPPQLTVVEIFPGYTIGGIYIAEYSNRETTIKEMDIIPALTRHEGRRGFYVHQQISDYTDALPNMHIDYKPIWRTPLRLKLSFLEVKGNGIVFQKVSQLSRVCISSSSIETTDESFFKEIRFKRKLLTISFRIDNIILVDKPSKIKSKVLGEIKSGVYGNMV